MIAGAERGFLTDQVTAIVRRAAKLPAGVPIRLESRLVEDLMIDSLDLVSLVLQFQDHFDVVIEEDAVPHLRSVGDIVDYLVKRSESAGMTADSQAAGNSGATLRPDVQGTRFPLRAHLRARRLAKAGPTASRL